MATALQHKKVRKSLLATQLYLYSNSKSFILGMGSSGLGASGGIGYGAGGGAGGASSGFTMYAGGNGTNGLVYIEWD